MSRILSKKLHFPERRCNTSIFFCRQPEDLLSQYLYKFNDGRKIHGNARICEKTERVCWRGDAKGQEVEFTYYAPKATKVFLAGKFNNWNTKSLSMKKNKDGYWKTTIKLSPGRYEYKYFIDGAWAQDASGSEKVLNSFGTYNNVIGVA